MQINSFESPLPSTVLALVSAFTESFGGNIHFRNSNLSSAITSSKEDTHVTEPNTAISSDSSSSLLNDKSMLKKKLFEQEETMNNKAGSGCASVSHEMETSQGRCSSLYSLQISGDRSTGSTSSHAEGLYKVSGRKCGLRNARQQKSKVVTHPRKLKIEWKKYASHCIDTLIRAVEEDLAKSAKKCANKCCAAIQQLSMNTESNMRNIMNCDEWLCDACVKAYDARQYCEFCYQLYLNDTDNADALDGKVWAQCEATDNCNSWAHVDCLASVFHVTREAIIAETFKYSCCDCKEKSIKKRKANSNKRIEKARKRKCVKEEHDL